jgi:hypothetical protein
LRALQMGSGTNLPNKPMLATASTPREIGSVRQA